MESVVVAVPVALHRPPRARPRARIDRNVKKHDPEADTTALEQEIDRLVYDLYGLTEEEIRVVEGGNV